MNKTNTKSTGSLRGLAMTLLMGSASAGLYFLLSLYSDTLQELAAATRQGDKLYALVAGGHRTDLLLRSRHLHQPLLRPAGSQGKEVREAYDG